MTRFRTILADPPWPERGGGKSTRGAQRHYSLIKTKEGIRCVMLQSGAFNLDTGGAHLYLWVTDTYLEWGLWIMGALGFKYKTNVAWVKTRIHLPGTLTSLGDVLRIGLGQYFRGSHELCLFGVRGETMLPTKALPSVLCAARYDHSSKPDRFYELIEQTSPGPYLEMFARNTRPGWESWGNEVI